MPYQPPTFYRRSLLVLLPEHDPPDMPPYVYLGMQFFSEVGARLELECSDPAGLPNGVIEI